MRELSAKLTEGISPPVTANAVTAPSSEGALGRAKFQFINRLRKTDKHIL